jgi:oxygen-dependent protoporphyrinogen oxidase
VLDQPSLIAGLRPARGGGGAPGADPGAPVFTASSAARRPSPALTRAIIERGGPDAVRLGAAVSAIEARAADAGPRYAVCVGDAELPADVVVLAVPSFAAAPLLAPLAPDVAAGLASLEWASCSLVTFAVPHAQIDHPLDGSGFLVSEDDGLLMTACCSGRRSGRTGTTSTAP